MITACNVLQYWPLCHDYLYFTITVVRMPLRPTFSCIGLCAMNDDNDTDNDDDYTGDNDAKLAFVPTDGLRCPCS